VASSIAYNLPILPYAGVSEKWRLDRGCITAITLLQCLQCSITNVALHLASLPAAGGSLVRTELLVVLEMHLRNSLFQFPGSLLGKSVRPCPNRDPSWTNGTDQLTMASTWKAWAVRTRSYKRRFHKPCHLMQSSIPHFQRFVTRSPHIGQNSKLRAALWKDGFVRYQCFTESGRCGEPKGSAYPTWSSSDTPQYGKLLRLSSTILNWPTGPGWTVFPSKASRKETRWNRESLFARTRLYTCLDGEFRRIMTRGYTTATHSVPHCQGRLQPAALGRAAGWGKAAKLLHVGRGSHHGRANCRSGPSDDGGRFDKATSLPLLGRRSLSALAFRGLLHRHHIGKSIFSVGSLSLASSSHTFELAAPCSDKSCQWQHGDLRGVLWLEVTFSMLASPFSVGQLMARTHSPPASCNSKSFLFDWATADTWGRMTGSALAPQDSKLNGQTTETAESRGWRGRAPTLRRRCTKCLGEAWLLVGHWSQTLDRHSSLFFASALRYFHNFVRWHPSPEAGQRDKAPQEMSQHLMQLVCELVAPSPGSWSCTIRA